MRPCVNINLLMNPNSGTVISALLQAVVPSFPAIPIPISASLINGISLAPSPIAAMVSAGFVACKILTILAFYDGNNLQNITD